MNTYEYLEEAFKDRAYLWKTDKGLVGPTAADIEAVVDRAVVELRTQPVGSMIEIGRLIIQRGPDGLHDIYMHIGEVK